MKRSVVAIGSLLVLLVLASIACGETPAVSNTAASAAATQTPFVIVVTATPVPATAVPTPLPTLSGSGLAIVTDTPESQDAQSGPWGCSLVDDIQGLDYMKSAAAMMGDTSAMASAMQDNPSDVLGESGAEWLSEANTRTLAEQNTYESLPLCSQRVFYPAHSDIHGALVGIYQVIVDERNGNLVKAEADVHVTMEYLNSLDSEVASLTNQLHAWQAHYPGILS